MASCNTFRHIDIGLALDQSMVSAAIVELPARVAGKLTGSIISLTPCTMCHTLRSGGLVLS